MQLHAHSDREVKFNVIWWILLLALSCTGVLAITRPAHAQEPGSGDGSWTWQNPLPQGNNLSGVWGTDAQNVWAVGDGGALLHWDGSNWTTQSSGTVNYLTGVWSRR